MSDLGSESRLEMVGENIWDRTTSTALTCCLGGPPSRDAFLYIELIWDANETRSRVMAMMTATMRTSEMWSMQVMAYAKGCTFMIRPAKSEGRTSECKCKGVFSDLLHAPVYRLAQGVISFPKEGSKKTAYNKAPQKGCRGTHGTLVQSY